MKYNCKIGFSDGTTSNIVANINDIDEFKKTLLEKDIFLIDIKPALLKFSFKGISDFFFQLGKTKKIINFTKLFSTLLKSGVNIDNSLLLLSEDEKDPKMKSIISSVREEVVTGSSLSSALSKQKLLFDTLYSRSVMAGEKSGNLPEILDRLLFFYKKRYALRKKVLMALIYPAILAVVAFLAVIGLVTILVPKFTEAFANMDIELPQYTKFVIATSDFLTTYGILLIFALSVIIYMIIQYVKGEKGKREFDSLKLKLPVLGSIIGYSLLSNFLRTLSTMIKGGIPVLESLIITKKAIGNVIYSEKIGGVIRAIENGDSFYEGLKKSEIFPDILVKMVKIGEESGQLENMLEEASLYFDDEIDTASTTLASLMEPVIMLGLSAVFLGIMLAIILPIFTASGQIH